MENKTENLRNAGRKKKFSVPQKAKTFRYPIKCEAKIIKAINNITKPYLTKNGK